MTCPQWCSFTSVHQANVCVYQLRTMTKDKSALLAVDTLTRFFSALSLALFVATSLSKCDFKSAMIFAWNREIESHFVLIMTHYWNKCNRGNNLCKMVCVRVPVLDFCNRRLEYMSKCLQRIRQKKMCCAEFVLVHRYCFRCLVISLLCDPLLLFLQFRFLLGLSIDGDGDINRSEFWGFSSSPALTDFICSCGLYSFRPGFIWTHAANAKLHTQHPYDFCLKWQHNLRWTTLSFSLSLSLSFVRHLYTNWYTHISLADFVCRECVFLLYSRWAENEMK